MGSRQGLILHLGRRRMRAVAASTRRRGIHILQTLDEEIPADVARDDPHMVGRWVGQRLREARFPRMPVTVAIGREHVGLKRLTLPTIDRDELPEMTRLAMQRDLPIDAGNTIIDFLTIGRTTSSTTVLAFAVHCDFVNTLRQVVSAAGFRLQRISVQSLGAASLVSFSHLDGDVEREQDSAPDSAGNTLIIDLTGEGVEFSVASDGRIHFSRAAEIPQPNDRLTIAEAVVTETRRTWMSCRVSEDVPKVQQAVIMGDRRVSDYVSRPVQEILGLPVSVVADHPDIETNDQELDTCWPLAGLMLESARGGETIDFTRPKQAPDVSARRRLRWLAAAGILIVVSLATWTMAKRDLDLLNRQVETLSARQQQLLPEFLRSWRDQFKLEHVKQWSTLEPDWLGHATYLDQLAPPPEQLVLDSWIGTLDYRGAAFDSQTWKWSADFVITIILDGEARNRETADAFRESLVGRSVYSTSSTGADRQGGRRLPYGFTYRLRTNVAQPVTTTLRPVSPDNTTAENQLGEPAPRPKDSPT